jgi:hypothetical protein
LDFTEKIKKIPKQIMRASANILVSGDIKSFDGRANGITTP